LPRIRLFAVLLALCITAGCKAQTTPPQTAAQGQPDAALNRRIEVMVRSQFSIPEEFSVNLGPRKPSQFPGYDSLSITISHGDKNQIFEFLISTDSKTLARLETFDLVNDPIFSIDVTGRPIRGNPAAKVTVISFDDLECPYCGRMHQTLFPATLDHYRKLVRFIYKDYPLPADMHPWAMHAAVDANCLAAQSGEAYWNYVDYLHSHGQEISGPERNTAKSFDALNRIAREQATLAKLDSGKLDACLAAQDESTVRASLTLGDTLKVEGVPALFVNGERIDGVVPQDKVWQVIDRALRAEGEEPPPPIVPPVQKPPSGANN
jgi:protein-disulfide isomerase